MTYKVIVTNITRDELATLLSDATYCNHAIEVEVPNDATKDVGEIRTAYAANHKKLCREDLWAELLLRGKSIVIYDNYEEDEEEARHEVCLTDIQTAIEKGLISNYSTSVARCIAFDGRGDMYDAFNVLQFAMFGEVVY